MEKHIVFVYGTLKTGEPNHHIISGCKNGFYKFLGKARTVEEYPLVIASQFNIPFLLRQKGIGKRITGEVYEVDDVILLQLDELENHPEYYIRLQEPVSLISDGFLENINGDQIIAAWTYFLPEFKAKLLELPFLDNYSSQGDHGLPYVTRYNDNPKNTSYIVEVRKF